MSDFRVGDKVERNTCGYLEDGEEYTVSEVLGDGSIHLAEDWRVSKLNHGERCIKKVGKLAGTVLDTEENVGWRDLPDLIAITQKSEVKDPARLDSGMRSFRVEDFAALGLEVRVQVREKKA